MKTVMSAALAKYVEKPPRRYVSASSSVKRAMSGTQASTALLMRSKAAILSTSETGAP